MKNMETMLKFKLEIVYMLCVQQNLYFQSRDWQIFLKQYLEAFLKSKMNTNNTEIQ